MSNTNPQATMPATAAPEQDKAMAPNASPSYKTEEQKKVEADKAAAASATVKA
jgi:hypothetical protein